MVITPSKLCVFGSCGESFSAVHLFRKYYDQGINMILENSPGSLDRAISRINFIAAWLFGFVGGALQAPPNSRCAQAPEDRFNSMEKIRQLPLCDTGYVLMAKTDGDELAPPEEVDEMATLIGERCSMQLLENHPMGTEDPHRAQFLKNPSLQESIIHQLCAM